MKALILVANLVGRFGEWVLSRADRRVCRFVEVTDDECPACPLPDDRETCCHDRAAS